MTIKIGLLAGEPSGDNLAAGLMSALRQQLDLQGRLNLSVLAVLR